MIGNLNRYTVTVKQEMKKECHIMLAFNFAQKMYLPPTQSIVDLFFVH